MQPNHFDANLLRTLDALLLERSVTRAAERVCVSQPAMSGALRRLREHFGDQILVRTGRDMALTPLAELLVMPVRKTLLQIQSTLATRPSFDPLASRRTFKVAMSDYAAFALMPGILRRLAAEAPLTQCHVTALGEDSAARVEAGELDAFVSIGGCRLAARPGAAGDMMTRGLYSDDFVCLFDPASAEIGERLSPEKYASSSHLVVRLGDHLETLIEQAWKRAGLEMNVVAVAPSFASISFMLPGTAMIATVQRGLAGAIAGSSGLQVVECPIVVPPLRQVLVWHGRSDLDPAHRYLRRLIAEAGEAIVARATAPLVPESQQRPSASRNNRSVVAGPHRRRVGRAIAPGHKPPV